MTEIYDVAVIGAGIVGVPTALHLLLRGQKTILIDRREPGLETSYGNSGVITNSYVLPFGFPAWNKVPDILLNRDTAARIHYPSLPKFIPWLIDFYRQSQTENRLKHGRQLWPLLRDANDDHRFLMQNSDAARHMHSAGRIAVYRTEAGFAGSALERRIATEMGIAFTELDAAGVAALEPDLKPIYRCGIQWTSSSRIDNPSGLVKAYAERFTREGGTLLMADVTKITAQQNQTQMWRADTTGSPVMAKNLVICMGPWAADFLKPFGYRFPLAFKRGYHAHYPAIGGAKLNHAVVDTAIGYVLTPMEQGYRVTTGAEITDRDAPPNPAQLHDVVTRARELFPLGDAIEAQPRWGNRPCFADSLPVIGQAPHHKGLWFNFGQGHVGLTTGPASGRLLAEMLTGAPTFCDPVHYRAERFTR